MSKYVIVALYKFVTLDDFEALKRPLLQVMEENGIKGTLLLAREGINGTVAGRWVDIAALKAWLESDPRLQGIAYKESRDDGLPFYRSRVKLKKEIVTMGVEDIDPDKLVGSYVKPEDWNKLILDPDVTVIDTRNDYEVEIGSFKNTVNPKTRSFREFPQYVEEHLNPQKHKKVAMFCTGGIRCEKSTAYLKARGFDEVYHLEGGILKYLENVPAEESLWQGECFVFDNRVTVDHSLEKGNYDQCHACRMPITEEDKSSEHYQQGVSCPHCIEKHTDKQRQRYQERENQVQLARERGEEHIGSDAVKTAGVRREKKYAAKNRDRQLARRK